MDINGWQRRMDQMSARQKLYELEVQDKIKLQRQQMRKAARAGMTEKEGGKILWDGLLFWKKKENRSAQKKIDGWKSVYSVSSTSAEKQESAEAGSGSDLYGGSHDAEARRTMQDRMKAGTGRTETEWSMQDTTKAGTGRTETEWSMQDTTKAGTGGTETEWSMQDTTKAKTGGTETEWSMQDTTKAKTGRTETEWSMQDTTKAKNGGTETEWSMQDTTKAKTRGTETDWSMQGRARAGSREAGAGRSMRYAAEADISPYAGPVGAGNRAVRPADLQYAMLWSEILGEPVSVKRRRKRMGQNHGN